MASPKRLSTLSWANEPASYGCSTSRRRTASSTNRRRPDQRRDVISSGECSSPTLRGCAARPGHIERALADIVARPHFRGTMTDTREKRLIEALRKVDTLGDVAPPHVQDPMTMVLRQKAIQADLMRWDDSRGQYVLTGTGRSRIGKRSHGPGAIIRFQARRKKGDGPVLDTGG